MEGNLEYDLSTLNSAGEVLVYMDISCKMSVATQFVILALKWNLNSESDAPRFSH